METAPFAGTAAGTSEWGTARRNAGWLLHDALNSAMPQIFDTIVEDGAEKRVLKSEATEAAKEKLAKIKDAFTAYRTTSARFMRDARSWLRRPPPRLLSTAAKNR